MTKLTWKVAEQQLLLSEKDLYNGARDDAGAAGENGV